MTAKKMPWNELNRQVNWGWIGVANRLFSRLPQCLRGRSCMLCFFTFIFKRSIARVTCTKSNSWDGKNLVIHVVTIFNFFRRLSINSILLFWWQKSITFLGCIPGVKIMTLEPFRDQDAQEAKVAWPDKRRWKVLQILLGIPPFHGDMIEIDWAQGSSFPTYSI